MLQYERQPLDRHLFQRNVDNLICQPLKIDMKFNHFHIFHDKNEKISIRYTLAGKKDIFALLVHWIRGKKHKGCKKSSQPRFPQSAARRGGGNEEFSLGFWQPLNCGIRIRGKEGQGLMRELEREREKFVFFHNLYKKLYKYKKLYN